MNTPSNLTHLINNSIRLHDAQQDDAGFAEHTFDDLSGPAYEMLQATYDLHNNFTTMLRGIFTDGQSAEDIIEQLRDLMADRQEHLDRATTDSGPARAAELMVTTAFITELGIIATSEAPTAVQAAAPAAVIGETLRARILHATSAHEASGESATLLRAIYLDEGQSDEAVAVQLRALQIEIRERITRFLSAPDRGIRRAAAETLLAEIDAIIGGVTPRIGRG